MITIDMLIIEFGGKEAEFPFGEKEKEIVGNNPLIEVYFYDSELKSFKAPASEFCVSIRGQQMSIKLTKKREGIIKLSKCSAVNHLY